MKINLLPKKKRKIIKLKNEFAKEVGVSLKDLGKNSMKRQKSSIGSRMVNRMVKSIKNSFK